jgi:LysR family transcriptional regulator, low CO2-responsive transcriptional regulator
LPLFERVGRRIAITEAGSTLLLHTREIVRALSEAEDAFDALRGLTAGRINLGVTSTAKYFAPHFLARFRELHPALAFRLAVSNREAAIESLAGNEVDLAIMGRPPETPATVAAAFAPHPLVVIASPKHPLARKRRIPVASLAAESFLVREPGSGTRSAMQHYFAEHDVPIRIGMEMASNETIKQAVMAGMGIAFLSRHTIGLELATKKLALLDVRGLPVMRQWHVVHLATKRLSPTALAFRAFVLKHGRTLLHDAT